MYWNLRSDITIYITIFLFGVVGLINLKAALKIEGRV
jgi:hypothetical protein